MAFTVETIGGCFPVQAEGRTSADRPFYFRARHGVWTLSVGHIGDPTDLRHWTTDEQIAGGADTTSGCMDEAEVRAILRQYLGREVTA